MATAAHDSRLRDLDYNSIRSLTFLKYQVSVRVSVSVSVCVCVCVCVCVWKHVSGEVARVHHTININATYIFINSVRTLRMSGAITLLPPHALMMCKG